MLFFLYQLNQQLQILVKEVILLYLYLVLLHFLFQILLLQEKAYSFALEVTTSGDYAITWPTSIKWEGGSAPDNTASGETDLYTFITVDGGTTYFGKKALTGVS